MPWRREGVFGILAFPPFFFFLFMATPTASGSSWARNWIWAAPVVPGGDQTYTSSATWATAVRFLTYFTTAGTPELFHLEGWIPASFRSTDQKASQAVHFLLRMYLCQGPGLFQGWRSELERWAHILSRVQKCWSPDCLLPPSLGNGPNKGSKLFPPRRE